MSRQKRIAIINDITGFGRCSTAVELPLISALKVQACPLPTAILSVHTGFPNYYLHDFTPYMKDYMDSWARTGLAFDGILTGFLSSPAQIGLISQCIKLFKKPGTLVIVDPVMGDYGRLYASYTDELCRDMCQLLEHADVITPNLTEACQLLRIPYPAGGQADAEMLEHIAADLAALGPRQVVITGLSRNQEVGNYLYERGCHPQYLASPKVGHDRSGTGDVFAAIVAASLVRGESLYDAVHKAVTFIHRTLEYTESLGLPTNYGLAFEEFLTELK